MTSPRFRPPQQTRSQETLDRILDAAEQVLEEKSFTEATLAEIMDRAGVTVGAFYRRFPDKDALLHLIDQRFFQDLYRRADEVLDVERWRGAHIADVVDEVTRTGVELYRRRKGIIRSLFLRARVDPVIQLTARKVNEHYFAKLRAVLLDPERYAEVTHADPHRAIALGFRMFLGALRETTVFSETWPEDELLEPNLASELSRQYLGYLGVSPVARGK